MPEPMDVDHLFHILTRDQRVQAYSCSFKVITGTWTRVRSLHILPKQQKT